MSSVRRDVETATVGHGFDRFQRSSASQPDDDGFLAFLAVPFDVRTWSHFARRVVPPPCGDPQLAGVLRHQHADPDGRGEVAAARGRRLVALLVVIRLLDGEKLAPLCAEFGISRKTGYKIYDRYKGSGVEAFTDRSRRPYRQANRLPEPMTLEIPRSRDGAR